jgi:hypothetical protein
MRVDQSQFSTSSIRRSGEKDTYVISPQNKLMFVGPAASPSDKTRLMIMAGLSTRGADCFDWKNIKFKKVKSAIMFGLLCDEYIGTGPNWRWEVWQTKALNMPEWMYRDHELGGKLPPLDGMPMQASMIGKSGAETSMLKTLAVRKIKSSDIVLAYPPGLKRVNNLTAVISSQTATFLQDVGDALGH